MKSLKVDFIQAREQERKQKTLAKVLAMKEGGFHPDRKVKTKCGAIGTIQRIIEDEAMVMVRMQSGRGRCQAFNPDNLTLLPKTVDIPS